MVGDKGQENQTIRPDFEAHLGRYDWGTNRTEFDMSGYGFGGQQATGSKWLQIDPSHRGETNRKRVSSPRLA